MASEPYCADAPSRRTSTPEMALEGMVFMSTADDPRPIEPLTLTSEAAWRRLELTSTSVWSGARPRSAAGRTVSVPSLSAGRGKLNEGSATDSAWFTSETPPFCSSSALTTSTATAVSSAVRSATRVPVTMTTSPSSAACCAMAWPNINGAAATPARMAYFNALNFIMSSPKSAHQPGRCLERQLGRQAFHRNTLQPIGVEFHEAVRECDRSVTRRRWGNGPLARPSREPATHLCAACFRF